MIVIQCATPHEFEALKDVFSISKIEKIDKRSYFLVKNHLIVLQGGMGKVWAAASCEMAIIHWNPKLMIDFGAAGALSPTLASGDIIYSKKVVEHDVRDTHRPALKWVESSYKTDRVLIKHGMISGSIASGDQDFCSLEDRKALHIKTQAVAVTWESAAIAKVCQFHKVLWICIRVITDVGHDNFLEEYKEGIVKFLKPAGKVMRDYVTSAFT